MIKCERRQCEISAIEWTGANLEDVLEFTGRHPKFDEWFESFEQYAEHVARDGFEFKIFTEYGPVIAVPGEFIVKEHGQTTCVWTKEAFHQIFKVVTE